MSPPVGQAVELYFDTETERRLMVEWERIGSDLRGRGARPHISLAVFRPPLDVKRIVDAIKQWSAEIPPLDIGLHAVGTFPGDAGVAFLAPAPSIDLLAGHERFHALLGDLERWELYLPGRWVPHCTMAMGLSGESLERVVVQLAGGDAFGPCRLERIGLVEYDPVVSRHETRLTGRR